MMLAQVEVIHTEYSTSATSLANEDESKRHNKFWHLRESPSTEMEEHSVIVHEEHCLLSRLGGMG